MPLTTAAPIFGIELAGGEVVEEEQRLRALHDEIVDRHGDEVDADGVVQAGLDRDLDLGADAVVGGDQHRVLEARALEVEQAAEAADLGVGARPRGRLHQRLDQLHHAVAGVDIDAGLRIGEALFAHALAYVGIRIVCNGSMADILRRNRKRVGPGHQSARGRAGV